MGLRDQLKTGMMLEQVRALLKGWRESMPSAFLSPDRTHLYYTVDFKAPIGSGEGVVRMTFDNGRLMHWGEPADLDSGSTNVTKSA